MRLHTLGLPGSQGLKPSMPQCRCNNLTKAKVLLQEISMLAPFLHFLCLPLAFVTLCFCSAHSAGTACLSLSPWAAGWAFAFFLLLPQTACWGDAGKSLPPPLGCRHCSAAPCQAVAVQLARSTLSNFKVTAQSRGTIPTARSPEALLNVVICGWASATSHESLRK